MTSRDYLPIRTPVPAASEVPAYVQPAGGDPFPTWERRATRWVAWLAVTMLVFYICWQILAPFLDIVLWAVALVIAFQPLHVRLVARLRSRNAAAAVTSLLVVFTILLPLTFVMLAVARDATRVAQYVQANREHLLDPEAPTPLGRALRYLGHYVDLDRVASGQYLAERVSEFSGTIARGTLNVVGGLAGAAVEGILIIFTMFFLFRDGAILSSHLRDLLPLDRWQADEVATRTRDVIYASVYGAFVVAAVQGALGGLAFWTLGIPSALLWATVMTALCMIPMAGSFFVWGPAALYLLAVGQPWRAVMLVAWGVLVISTVDNVLRLKVVGPRTRMHELVVFFSVIGGVRYFGAIGLVAGPVVAAVAMALVDLWRRSSRAPAAAAIPPAVPPPPSCPQPTTE